MAERAFLRTILLTISMIMIVVAFAPPASAQTHFNYKPTAAEADRFAQILTYEELSRLGAKEQQTYLLGLRETMIDVEDLLKARDNSSAQAKRMSAQLQFIKSVIAQAEAAAGAPNSVPAWAANAPSFRRFSNTRELVAAYSSSPAYRCSDELLRNDRIKAQIKNGVKVACMPSVSNGCRPGFTNFGWDHGRIFCANVDEYAAKRRADRASAALQSSKAKAKADGAARRLAATKGRTSKPNGQPPKREKLVATSRSQTRVVAAEGTAKPEPVVSAEASSVAPTVAPVGAGSSAEPEIRGHQLVATEDRHSVVEGIERAVELAANGTISGFKDISEEGTTDCGALGPDPDPATCNADSIAANKKLFYPDESPHCIYAGNISHIKSGWKIPGNCQAPQSFCLGSVTCRDRNNNTILNANPKFTCAKDKVICNPYIFDIKTDGTAICVDKSQQATRACETESAKYSHDKAFIFRLQDANGIREGWNDYAASMNSMCKSRTASAGYFCVECHLLKVRLIKLKLATMRYNDEAHKGEQCYQMFGMDKKKDPVDGTPAAQPTSTTTAPAPAAANK